LELVLSGWQESGTMVACSCVGVGMHVVFSGRLSKAPMGVWMVGNRRVGVSFNVRQAAGRFGDPAAVPDILRACVVDAEIVLGIELVLETGEECGIWQLRAASSN
jgi:hypothetical protein